MPRHRIALKGPWQVERLPDDEEAAENAVPAPQRIRMPAEWRTIVGTQAGRMRFRRTFHRPTNLGPREAVFLVFEAVGGEGRVWLNGDALGPLATTRDAVRFEVTSLLQPTNDVAVELEFDPRTAGESPGGLWKAVVLEIDDGDGE